MKFIVCIKQVPDVAAPIRLSGGDMIPDPGRLLLNAYDASAVEEAIVLTERHGGEVHVVLVGPAKAQEAIRKALAMGAEAGVHLQISEEAAPDSRAYAQILARHLRDTDFDVIACGKQAQDTDAGLTGPMLAELLGLPFVANAVRLELEGKDLIVTRQGDAGREIFALPTPCLVTCSNDMNDPRIPNLKGIMQAKRKTIESHPVNVPADLATKVRRYESVPEREPGRLLEGEPDEVAQKLVDLLKNEAGVL